MNYFAGLGAGKGCNKFKFVLTPDELKEIFTQLDYSFVITNQRVTIDYTVDDTTSLFQNYDAFFTKITSGEPWDKNVSWPIENGVRLSITQDPKKIKFVDSKERNGNVSKEFKLVRPEEPVINIAPFYLNYQPDELSIETMNHEGILGLEFSFPKVVTLSSEGHEKVHETSGYNNNKLFDELTNRIKEKTRKAKLTSPTKTFRPNFWVSVSSLESINKHHYLKKSGLHVA
jgi:hypothetical protein